MHPDAGAYAAFARAAGFTVKGAGMAHEAWDFGSRPAFAHFAAGTFVAWTSRLPKITVTRSSTTCSIATPQSSRHRHNRTRSSSTS